MYWQKWEYEIVHSYKADADNKAEYGVHRYIYATKGHLV